MKYFTAIILLVKTILNSVGYIVNDTTAEHLDLTDLFAKILLGGSMPLFEIGIDVDKQSGKYILQVSNNIQFY